ncbi:hypothetical protein AXA44_47365 [Rhodococcus sp. SC4]|nr:hypothetical protein AXA44_47365 [Rhodococcus sp. SC4]
MLNFAQKWRHWGGGSREEILVEFGLSQGVYFQHLLSQLNQRIGIAAGLPAPVLHQLAQKCRSRLRDRRTHPRRFSATY